LQLISKYFDPNQNEIIIFTERDKKFYDKFSFKVEPKIVFSKKKTVILPTNL
jgi:hypothetical protein